MKNKTKIYFDGACPFCSREIAHYRRKDVSSQCEFIDIASPLFDATAENVDPIRINQVMHVYDAHGQLHQGVDAFLEIWKLFPKYKKLVPLAKLPGIYQLLKVGYSLFAKNRHRFSKKKLQRGI